VTNLGIARRNGTSGLYQRDHDLGGVQWHLLLRLDRATANHLHDHGVIVFGDAAAVLHGATPGIVIHDGHVEARLALGMPASVVATAQVDDAWRLEDEAAGDPPISRLYASSRPD